MSNKATRDKFMSLSTDKQKFHKHTKTNTSFDKLTITVIQSVTQITAYIPSTVDDDLPVMTLCFNMDGFGFKWLASVSDSYFSSKATLLTPS